jgi:GTA TIM-barrel-like domain/Putative phage tail protein
MATLVLQAAGSVLGNLAGGPVGGAIGAVIGASLGAAVDQTLLSAAGAGSGGRRITQGPRLKDLDGISAIEGAAIPRLYGRARLGGQVIWSTRFQEEAVASASKAKGGKGGLGAAPKASVSVSYRYFANFAVGLCEGEIAFVRRVWADGKELDLTGLTMRVHTGTEDQAADPLIVARQGASGAPAYRGLAYVVFERLALENFGNRLPQLSFEVVRPVHGIARQIRAVNLIPGAGEYVYEPRAVSRLSPLGASSLPNRTQLTHGTNWHASLDALQALCPNLENVALVVSWFGDDLRCGSCAVKPLTEPGSIDGDPHSWSVAGLTRAMAGIVSAPGGKPAYGGTPSDGSVMRAIRDLKSRGLNVTLYPFIMMDVPSGNTKADPWTGAASQPAYPWRGRITCSPAPGRPETAEGALAETQIAAFMGTCLASHFTVGTDMLSYSGPAEWTLRRLVLHCAGLARAAGGVDAMVLGSELTGLTRVRGTGAVNPAVLGLKALAAEVRALLGTSTKITYGADWTEYGAEVRAAGDVRFPLDPLWADANIDAVAIDWYPPVTDWRDGEAHLDAAAFDGPHDAAMFKQRLAGGEAFDWYYADDAGRAAQNRLPITDGAYGKPWIYRAKDILGWWSNPHCPRVGGLEQGQTAWVPQSKPVWLLECGGPAVDRGGNAPNMFADPKSSESGLPPFSRGARDDLAQSRLIAATLGRFDPQEPEFVATDNPVSAAYGGRMVDPARSYVWCWDARPFPSFPDHAAAWGDGAAWETGHWLNGRLEGMPTDDLIGALLADFGVAAPASFRTSGFLDGYVLDRPMTARAALEPLTDVFGIDAVVQGGILSFRRRGRADDASLSEAGLVIDREQPGLAATRGQASEFPMALSLGFSDPEQDYRQGAVRASVQDPATVREAAFEVAAALPRAVAAHRAEVMLAEARIAREAAVFRLPWSRAEITPGDTVALDGARWRVLRINDGASREVTAARTEPGIQRGAPRPVPPRRRALPPLGGPAAVTVLDLALAGTGGDILSRIAVTADPWAGGYTLWRSDDGQSFTAEAAVPVRATIGRLLAPLPAGPLWRFDRNAVLELELSHGELQSLGEVASLAGGNMLAVEAAEGWEIMSFASAELTGFRQWRLSGLVRGLAGSEPHAGLAKPTGNRVVLLDGAVQPLASGAAELGRQAFWRIAPEGRDHADPMAVSLSTTATGEALLPLAPVRLAARRVEGGVRLSWIRRARGGGDSWELAEVPLGEAEEAYALDILSGATVKRSVRTSAPVWLYGAADEMADFGAPQTALRLRVRQISQAAGPGRAGDALVPVE